ncbi:MAG TPA: NAD(+) diphosphatase [Hyphomicrobiaceae bacterium]|nr:NAD(+) diphosphatase [Hyphomicrobiaceae bacterium]
MPTVAATTLLDRAGPRRADEAWLKAHVADPRARFLLLVDLKPVIVSGPDRSASQLRWLSGREVGALGLPLGDAMFLGIDAENVAHFALPITDHLARATSDAVQFLRPAVDLRSLAMQGALTPEELSLAGQARALAQWHENARCCGRCGSTLLTKDGGWRKKCWGCGLDSFPRTDPVVIMLITDGNRCILAHEYRYAEKMWSTLAGFLEPGEDIEHAVRREVLEETSIRVGKVAYHSSQPWPFPHSLMLGCVGHAETTEIHIDTNEIAEARWFTREEARMMLEHSHPEGLTAPGPHAIANALIRSFVEQKLPA